MKKVSLMTGFYLSENLLVPAEKLCLQQLDAWCCNIPRVVITEQQDQGHQNVEVCFGALDCDGRQVQAGLKLQQGSG